MGIGATNLSVQTQATGATFITSDNSKVSYRAGVGKKHGLLGGGNSKIFGIFTPNLGEDFAILTCAYFSTWVGEKAPTTSDWWRRRKTPPENDELSYEQRPLKKRKDRLPTINFPGDKPPDWGRANGWKQREGGVIWMHVLLELGWIHDQSWELDESGQIIATSHDLGPQTVV